LQTHFDRKWQGYVNFMGSNLPSERNDVVMQGFSACKSSVHPHIVTGWVALLSVNLHLYS
jgi:hypothetical protein